MAIIGGNMFEVFCWGMVFLVLITAIYWKDIFKWWLIKTGRVQKCPHKRFTRKQFFAKDGTPLYYFNCWDCGYNDQGHVHGDPEQMKKDGWEKEEYGEGAL